MAELEPRQNEVKKSIRRNADKGCIATMMQHRQDTKIQCNTTKILRHNTIEN